MQIKIASNQDVDAIVLLLRKSLGESQLPFSKEIWEYKHQKNTSGNSLVLLAISEEGLIGIRVLMKWRWQLENRIFSTYRAVDTGTHPNFQRKGVFRSLNREAVERAMKHDGDFIFNTPNKQSLPGNLKMGWIPVGKVKVGVKIWWRGFKFPTKNILLSYEFDKQGTDLEISELCKNWNQHLQKSQRMFCPKSVDYLHWRYEINPLQEYQIFSNRHFYMAGYLKRRGRIKELRIAECIFYKDTEVEKAIKLKLREWCFKFNPQIITFSPDFFVSSVFSVEGRFGPILTFRPLTVDSNTKRFLTDINNWSYSLGDLELY